MYLIRIVSARGNELLKNNSCTRGMSCLAGKIKCYNIAAMSSLNLAIREGFLEEGTSKDASELLVEEAEGSLVTVSRESAH